MSRTRHRRDRREHDATHRRAALRPLPCPVCALPWSSRALIELSASNGAALRWLADHFGISRGQIRRHLNRCHGGDA